ncbi:MAG: hypothetical protein IIC23_14055 [Chloroflexi bacterium]|nr:hypothetical protein [Chloroflexota bacterium]
MADDKQRSSPGPINRGRYEASLKRLDDIFRDISDSVTEVSKWRCPYKNVKDRCTANFGCRNQDRSVPEGELFICLSDDNLDYRSAWELLDDERTNLDKETSC